MSAFRHSIRSKKSIRKKLDHFFTGIIIITGTCFVFLILFLSTAFIPWFVVKKIEIQGNRVISGEILDRSIRTELEQKIFWFIPRRSIFLISTKKIASDILKKFPKLAKIEIDRSGFKSLRVVVSERVFTGLWCSDMNNDCFLVDKNGIAYEKFPPGISTEDLLILKNFNTPKILTRFIDASIYADILKSVSFLTGIGFEVAEFDFTSPDEYIFVFKKGGKIMLGNNFYFELINKFPLLIKEYDWKTGADFEYVDLRFPNKAFIKK